ncbi:MAG: hypothetical protein CVU63_05285 [Deltaproteobacteria bacterium HGW-Deltaproteobacteria-20]|jgi:hypothetical protein|nr:MAG: hypothetical protein CVU63_05285 [Deltaproteobacteria bacterium HGW-Deltaproteobacteria-20]
MRSQYRFPSAGLLFVLLASGCAVGLDAPSEEDFAGEEEAVVSTTQPFACSPTNADLWPIGPMSGKFEQKGMLAGAASVNAYYTDGTDMASAPVSSESSWKSSNAGNTTCGMHAPSYSGKITEALNAAKSHMVVDTSEVTDSFDTLGNFLEKLGVKLNTNSSVGATEFQGYAPERSRWLRYQYVRTSGVLPRDEKNTYPEPQELKDLRLQGGRLYCAFKEAQRRQNGVTHSMGELPAISVNILGKKVDFLVVNPTVALGSPAKFAVSTSDGAEAFTVPMAFGTTITPVKGIGIPGLRELRAPLAMVSGDSEVSQKASYGQIISTYAPTNGLFKPVYTSVHKKEHQTVVHSDAIFTKGYTAHADTSFTLMYIGPVKVSTNFALDINAGDAQAWNDRVLDDAFPYAAFPDVTRTGWNGTMGAAAFHDGLWSAYLQRTGTGYDVLGFLIEPEGLTDAFFRMPISEIGAMRTRAMQDDDRHVATSTSLGLTMGLSASLGKSFGPVDVSLTASGKVTGSVTQVHDLRDGLYGQTPHPSKNRVLAANGVTVRPRTLANATLNPLDVKLHFKLSLLFDTIEWTATLLNVKGTNLADYDSDENKAWGERASLRVGVGSEAGDSMKKPSVLSHLPGGGTYSSFPATVDQCLAEAASTAPMPPPCEAAPASGAPPQAELCAYAVVKAPSGLYVPPPPTNVCGNVAVHAKTLALGPALETCTKNVLQYLCGPVSREQTVAASSTAVAHVASSDAALTELGNLLRTCGNTAQSNGYSSDAIESWFQGLVQFSPCDSTARLLGPDEVFAPSGDPGLAPAPSAPGTCQ